MGERDRRWFFDGYRCWRWRSDDPFGYGWWHGLVDQETPAKDKEDQHDHAAVQMDGFARRIREDEICAHPEGVDTVPDRFWQEAAQPVIDTAADQQKDQQQPPTAEDGPCPATRQTNDRIKEDKKDTYGEPVDRHGCFQGNIQENDHGPYA